MKFIRKFMRLIWRHRGTPTKKEKAQSARSRQGSAPLPPNRKFQIDPELAAVCSMFADEDL